jgi:hypothetical protein
MSIRPTGQSRPLDRQQLCDDSIGEPLIDDPGRVAIGCGWSGEGPSIHDSFDVA